MVFRTTNYPYLLIMRKLPYFTKDLTLNSRHAHYHQKWLVRIWKWLIGYFLKGTKNLNVDIYLFLRIMQLLPFNCLSKQIMEG